MSTYNSDVLSSTPINDEIMLSPCPHEEADTRVMLLMLHSVSRGFEKMCVRTVNMDVVK